MTKAARPEIKGSASPGGKPGEAPGADAIAVGLQQLFASIAEEPVPDEFMALLDRIEAAERQRHAESAAPPALGAEGMGE